MLNGPTLQKVTRNRNDYVSCKEIYESDVEFTITKISTKYIFRIF